jgi:hypothetical protein
MNCSATELQRATDRLQSARARIRARPVGSIIAALAETAQTWLRPDGPWRQRALAEAPASTGFSPPMIGEAIELTFGVITADALGHALDCELGDRRMLDGFVKRQARLVRASGPALIVHFLAGNLPAPAILSICRGLLLKAGNLVRASSRETVLPRLFVESLRATDRDLADCVALMNWPREDAATTQAAINAADAVIAYGNDETVSGLRARARSGQRFVGYGHKLSLGMLARETVTAARIGELCAAAAFDVSVYDQQGCLSPHAFYVETGGEIAPREFAEQLAGAMEVVRRRLPRGALAMGAVARLASLRHESEFRAASDPGLAVWAPPDPQAPEWMVICEHDPVFRPSCLNRVVYVKPVDDLRQAVEALRAFSGRISTVGLAAADARTLPLTDALTELGVHRICRIGQMQRPPLAWHHDGRPTVADLVTWTDLFEPPA